MRSPDPPHTVIRRRPALFPSSLLLLASLTIFSLLAHPQRGVLVVDANHPHLATKYIRASAVPASVSNIRALLAKPSARDTTPFIDDALFEPLYTVNQNAADQIGRNFVPSLAKLYPRRNVSSRFPRFRRRKPSPPPKRSTPSTTPSVPESLSNDCPYTSTGAAPSKLHKCAMGYAATAQVTGGFGKTCGGRVSPVYVVTSSADDQWNPAPGTLRWATKTCSAGVFITFATSMRITLVTALFVPRDTTIDGRGKQVVITGAAVVLLGVSNVIISNVEISDIPGDTDIMHIRNAQRVWVDHLRVLNASRGTISVVYGATDVTVSNTYLYNANLQQLLGASDDNFYDRDLRVTLYRNWYDRSGQRQPHCRWGTCHAANCLYTGWTFYCLGGRVYGRIRSERNHFIADTRKTITPWFGSGALTTPGFDYTSTIRSYGDRYDNGAIMHDFPGTMPPFNPPYSLSLMDPLADGFKTFIEGNAGPKFPASEALVEALV